MNDYMKGWLVKANNDFKTIELLLNSKEDLLTDVICFHSQQSIEKFLKSFLIHQNKRFDETHNLDYLRTLCLELDSNFEKFDFQLLRPYAVQIRYGNELYIASDKEALEAYNMALELKNYVLQKLNLSEADLKL